MPKSTSNEKFAIQCDEVDDEVDADHENMASANENIVEVAGILSESHEATTADGETHEATTADQLDPDTPEVVELCNEVFGVLEEETQAE